MGGLLGKTEELVLRAKQLPRTLSQPHKVISQHLEITEEFCIVCKTPRINSDPTGLTCGEPKCLASLAGIIEKMKEEAVKEALTEAKNSFSENLSGLIKILGLKSITQEGPEGSCNWIAEKIENINEILKSAAVEDLKLELPEDIDLLGLCEKIAEEIKNIAAKIEEATKQVS